MTATLEVNCENRPANSQNVEGQIGPDSEAEVLVTAHVDAHDISEGARDNGVGSALVVEVARLLSESEVDLDTGVRFITFGSEEIGLLGAYHWMKSHDPDHVKYIVNIDGAGYSRTLRINTHGFDAIESAVNDVSNTLSISIETYSMMRPHGDHWAFVEQGIPAAYTKSVQEVEGRSWGHTHADTLDTLL